MYHIVKDVASLITNSSENLCFFAALLAGLTFKNRKDQRS